jgi:hypothetical protein
LWRLWKISLYSQMGVMKNVKLWISPLCRFYNILPFDLKLFKGKTFIEKTFQWYIKFFDHRWFFYWVIKRLGVILAIWFSTFKMAITCDTNIFFQNETKYKHGNFERIYIFHLKSLKNGVNAWLGASFLTIWNFISYTS